MSLWEQVQFYDPKRCRTAEDIDIQLHELVKSASRPPVCLIDLLPALLPLDVIEGCIMPYTDYSSRLVHSIRRHLPADIAAYCVIPYTDCAFFTVEKGLHILAANLCHFLLLYERIRYSGHPVIRLYIASTTEFYHEDSLYASLRNASSGCQRLGCSPCRCGDPVVFGGSACVIV